ncbi:DUF3742 family protein [Paraburkholderia ginsengisoli]|uniref:DUF3742 family protein n=1 Tax=Paraburkholderia ginsengisoli TaxID=311231 RepID=A0A7T4T8W9_9BURK|nr:DUF3742 family protein [Paraburkholderia ginsengisoli]QQC64337.1 DUF3742 family protein [Paraburkholderia ginsengisoli]
MAADRHHSGIAYRVGHWLGHAWRWFVVREQHAVDSLIRIGVPKTAAWVILWIVKLALLGVLLYGAFWLAILLAFAIAAAWIARNNDWSKDPEPEWRHGPTGYGLYASNGYRIDPHDPEDEQD